MLFTILGIIIITLLILILSIRYLCKLLLLKKGINAFDLPTMFLTKDIRSIQYNDKLTEYLKIKNLSDITFETIIKKLTIHPVSEVLDAIASHIKSKKKDIMVFALNKENNLLLSHSPNIIKNKSYDYILQIQSVKENNIAECSVGEISLNNLAINFNTAPIAQVILDKDLNLIASNKTFINATAEEIIVGKNFLNFLQIQQNSKSITILHSLKMCEGIKPIEFYLKSSNNEYTTGFAISNKNYINIYLMNNSLNQKLQIQLLQSQKLHSMGELAGGIAHDFNNILAGIIGFCDILISKSNKDDDSYADLMQIKQNSDRAAILVRKLLAFSKQQNLQAESIDIVQHLLDLYMLLEKLAGKKIKIHIKHITPLPLVYADHSQLEQLFVNMIINARDAMPNGGEIIIITRHKNFLKKTTYSNEVLMPGNYLEIMIADTGKGIKQDIIHMIFDPFFSTKGAKGNGLGLATSYGAVKQLGGIILVESQEGQGTTFKIYLPCVKPGNKKDTNNNLKTQFIEEAAIENNNKSLAKNNNGSIEKNSSLLQAKLLEMDNDTNNNTSNNIHHITEAKTTRKTIDKESNDNDSSTRHLFSKEKPNILLVEDELAIRMFGSRVLRNKGYHVIEAIDGKQGLEYVKESIKQKQKIDLIITDIIMPNMDGHELFEHVKKIIPDVNILFISGYTESNFRDELIKGKMNFLSKPFNLQDLLQKVNNLLPKQKD